MRGNRVAPMQLDEIRFNAWRFCVLFGLLENGRVGFDKIFEKFYEYGITIKVKSSREWNGLTLGLTDGHCDPNTLTISIPEKTYTKACKGDCEALSTMFHETGHLLLAHKAVLHHSNTPPEQNEDAEWQADMFAEFVLKIIGLTGGEQMLLDFDK